ncbi:HEAT repeat [Fragilaria crotonensis]|nr:HEAT repeat [Fragilaria crotonensis]
MDFSSPQRALSSLTRRQPVIDGMVELSDKMRQSNEDYVEGCLSLLSHYTSSDRWEPLAVGLYLATNLCNKSNGGSGVYTYVEGPRVPLMDGEDASDMLVSHEELLRLGKALLEASTTHLEHKEPRVRTLVAKAVGAVIALKEDSLLDAKKLLHDSILNSLYHHLEAGRDETTANYSKSSTGALDDTTGWRALETNWQGLASYVAASDYFAHFTLSPQLLEACEYSCIKHVNRHVRAAGIAVLEQWVTAAKDNYTDMLLDPSSPLRLSIVKVLKVTLADNWSQVRMAASVLCRVFFQALLQHPREEWHTETLYPTLIPRMCLNRFYLAQGVKLYSHDTWLILFEHGGGVDAVAQCAPAICRYYVQMCDADNHAVREAACQAVAELALKLGTSPKHADSLAPHVQTLLQALLMCFHDESWPVRDEACLACGRFVRAYPEESLAELPMLKEKWFEQLTDQIWSVREDAAVALGDAMLAYPDMQRDVLDFLKSNLSSAKDQPAMTKEDHKKHQNDIDAHSEQQLYSCGSLAPKLRKGGAGRIGCGNCGVSRPKAPWETTDGCIYLMRELIGTTAEVSPPPDDILLPLMQQMADVCRLKHFPHADDMRATLFRQLPVMARALGKQRFKTLYLQMFMDVLMNAMESKTESALSQHAAGQCAEELGELVGPNIFRGRLDEYQQRAYDKVMQERRNLPRGPTMAQPFFGSPMPGPGGMMHPGVMGVGG